VKIQKVGLSNTASLVTQLDTTTTIHEAEYFTILLHKLSHYIITVVRLDTYAAIYLNSVKTMGTSLHQMVQKQHSSSSMTRD